MFCATTNNIHDINIDLDTAHHKFTQIILNNEMVSRTLTTACNQPLIATPQPKINHITLK